MVEPWPSIQGMPAFSGPLDVHGATALPPGVPATAFTAVNEPRPQVGEANRAAKAVRVARRRADRESEPDAPDGPSPAPRMPRRNSKVPNCCCLL